MRSPKINKTVFAVLLLFTTYTSLAAQFVATVSDNKISAGQSLQLNLTLKDAKAKKAPDLQPLNKDFEVYGQQKYSTFNSTNGVIVSESGWDITLMPKHDGEVIIPSIQISTDNGVLSTAELRVFVTSGTTRQQNSSQGGAGDVDNDAGLGISLVSTINKDSVFVKEPLIYTLKIISYRNILNLSLEDIKSSDATIDKVSEPKQYRQVIGGRNAHVFEIKYYVTPVNTGKIVIAPAIVFGEAQIPSSQTQRGNNMSTLNNFFFNDSMSFKPFRLKSEQFIIHAVAPQIKDKSWLPLQNLTLIEEWKGLENAKVGDTIIRKIKMVANGSFSNQLPSVQRFMDVNGLKSYADKPTYSNDVKSGSDLIVGTKEETFTLVSTQAGNIILPEITVPWYNLHTKRDEVASLPAKTITIAAGALDAAQDAIVDYSVSAQDSANQITQDRLFANMKSHKLEHALIATLVTVICAMFGAIIYLLRSKNKVIINKPKRKKKLFAEKRTIDSPIYDAADLRDHILLHAIAHWQAPKYLTFNKLGTHLTDHNYTYDMEIYVLLCHEINAELYANTEIEFPVLLDVWMKLRDSVTKTKSQMSDKSNPDYINLNPT